MKIAYIVLAHRYPEQLIRMVNRLDTQSATFLIHVDKKTNRSIYEHLLEEFQSRPNVYFIKRYTCFWAGFGIVQATFQGIREAFDRGLDFDYLALLSGQDYPIKTNEYINQFLQRHKGKSFIHFNPFPYQAWQDHNGGWDRINFWHIIRESSCYVFPPKTISCANRTLNLIWRKAVSSLPVKRKFPNNFHPYGGAQFWCLYKTHAKHVHHFICQNPAYFRFFRFVLVPDEILFQSIIGNSEHTKDVVSDTLHYVEWDRPRPVLYKSDMDTIKSSDYLFARKFDCTVDSEVLDLVDREVLGFAAEESALSNKADKL